RGFYPLTQTEQLVRHSITDAPLWTIPEGRVSYSLKPTMFPTPPLPPKAQTFSRITLQFHLQHAETVYAAR
ncbi:MAG: hypothetical protein UDK36_09280, partial [Bacteroidaceae bacterium]|nr:hypothetical protein [Bacteroidaceae bacterium]